LPVRAKHQHCRSLIITPDGRIHAQSEFKQEQILVADLEIERATRAMFRYDLEDCAELLFADTVKRE
jgi:predicted amidohydrolase